MLDVKRLRMLREFAIRGTIGEVADVLAYSSSAVSQQLSQLEREAGVPLLRKVGRGLELTPAGERLVADTEDVLRLLERAEAALRRGDTELTGTVRIAAFQSAMISLIPRALKILSARYPRLRIEVVQHEPETALHETWARGFDVVIAEQYPGHAAPHHPGIMREVLGRDEITLAIPVNAGDRFDRVRTITDAAHLPWVMEPRGAASRHWAEQACRLAGFEPDVRYETADIQAHLRLIEAGHAVALVNGLSLHSFHAQLRFAQLPSRAERTVFVGFRDASEAHPAQIAIREALASSTESLPLSSP